MIASARSTQAAQVRPARMADIAGITALINAYAAQGIMLARTPASVELSIDDHVVAVDGHGRVIACGALREYSPSVAEVASVAVASNAHGQGFGTRIVRAVEELAARRGIAELFALTLTTGFFVAAGYEAVDRALYPEKIRKDCRGCTRQFACSEVCVQRRLGRATMAAAA